MMRIRCFLLGHKWSAPYLSFWPDLVGRKHLVQKCHRCGRKRLSS